LGRVQALGLPSLERGVRALLVLQTGGDRREAFHIIADLPEAVAVETGLHAVVILDEFQAVQRLNLFKDVKTTVADIFQFLRSKWQRQRRVMYVVSGSEISLLEQIIHREQAPFFQHFAALRLCQFPEAEGQRMMTVLFAQAGHQVDQGLIAEMVSRFDGHPFYLQVLGEELCRAAADPAVGGITLALYKTVAEETLLGQGGRLYLYFQGMYERAVGTATSLAQALITVAHGRCTVSQVARALRRSSNVVSSWLRRLVEADVLIKEQASYRFADPVFGLWVQGTRPPYEAIGGPYLIGDETERQVAYALGREGFRLVFQSRASRGAFDLLALLNATQVGIQVKRTSTWPFYLPAAEVERMRDWAQRLAWVPVLCVVRGEKICYYRPVDLVCTDESYRVDDATQGFETLLRLLAAEALRNC
jgi:Holliday junction resolvase